MIIRTVALVLGSVQSMKYNTKDLEQGIEDFCFITRSPTNINFITVSLSCFIESEKQSVVSMGRKLNGDTDGGKCALVTGVGHCLTKKSIMNNCIFHSESIKSCIGP